MGILSNKKPDYIELAQPINCIPAGTYKVCKITKAAIQLSVSSKIMIAIIGDFSSFVRPVATIDGIKNRIKREDFLDRYYMLLEVVKNAPADLSKPYTFCALDPSLAREMN